MRLLRLKKLGRWLQPNRTLERSAQSNDSRAGKDDAVARVSYRKDGNLQAFRIPVLPAFREAHGFLIVDGSRACQPRSLVAGTSNHPLPMRQDIACILEPGDTFLRTTSTLKKAKILELRFGKKTAT